MIDDPALLKAEGQQASLWSISNYTMDDFERILASAPPEFSSNDIRFLMDLAQIPRTARGGMFNAALKAGFITRKITSDGYPARIPSTDPLTHSAFVQVYRRAA